MFPICDEQGGSIGFSGRILSGEKRRRKYVNSPETPIFTKSKVFFGLDKSKRAVLDARLGRRLRRAARSDRVFHGRQCKTSSRRKARRSRRITRASSNVMWTKSCCVSIRMKPARMPPCGSLDHLLRRPGHSRRSCSRAARPRQLHQRAGSPGIWPTDRNCAGLLRLPVGPVVP